MCIFCRLKRVSRAGEYENVKDDLRVSQNMAVCPAVSCKVSDILLINEAKELT